MERSVAIKKLAKILGKSLAYRVDIKAPTQDERSAAKAELLTAIAERNKLRDQKDARYKAILAADAEYQSLHASHKAASKHADQLSSIIHHYKFTVGTTNGMFFHIKAQGDSWEEVIENLEHRRGRMT
jgi:hypothetical protein